MRFPNFLNSRRFFMGLTYFLIPGALFAAAGVIWLGSSFLIKPSRRPLEARHHELLKQPHEYGLSIERKVVAVDDETELETLLALRSQHTGQAVKTREMTKRLSAHGVFPTPSPRGTIILLHGRGGIKEDMLWVAKRFVAADFRCIVYDARAHGSSGGQHCTFGEREIRDMEQVLCAYRDQLYEKGETLGPVGAFGNSLGAAVILQSFGKFSPDTPSIDAAIAVAPFASLPEIVVSAGKKKIHRYLPSSFIHASMHLGGWRAGFNPFSISPLKASARSNTPLFLAHGNLDGVIPIAHSHQIMKSSQAKPLVWREVPEGYHSNVLATGGDDLYEEMVLFYLETLKHESAQSTPRNRSAKASLSDEAGGKKWSAQSQSDVDLHPVL